jgi:hypothetical protein
MSVNHHEHTTLEFVKARLNSPPGIIEDHLTGYTLLLLLLLSLFLHSCPVVNRVAGLYNIFLSLSTAPASTQQQLCSVERAAAPACKRSSSKETR